jgi:hypothetical protein
MSSAYIEAPDHADDYHADEPIRGLPALLPAGETILWQGAPAVAPLARQALHVRKIAVYFAVLAVWGIASRLSHGSSVGAVALAMLKLAALAVVAEGLFSLLAFLVARTTVYTITSRRVVIRFGIALPITVQIPFASISSAGLRLFRDGAGDIALVLQGDTRLAYLMLWPHARPWRFARAEPALRAVPDAAAVAALLGRALAASAAQPVSVSVRAESTHAKDGRVPAAA